MTNREAAIEWFSMLKKKFVKTEYEGYLDLAISVLEKQEEDRWIPVTERLPETTDPVNVTWVNNDPVSYYEDIRGKRFTATACYHRDKWWWYSAVCQDLLDEYGKSCMDDEIDEVIEILAWRPLPEPYTEEKA
jgi:hypothetical protein